MMRKEIIDQMAKIKRENRAAKQKAKQESNKDFEVAASSLAEEVKKCQEKILKLANQFDKELTDRDKQSKKNQTTMWDDI